ncbi:hypothetical protein KKA15_02120 [Patescibacteria group bacterium]|nr:hypothetical protein [Patescibacteria group bacterium]
MKLINKISESSGACLLLAFVFGTAPLFYLTEKGYGESITFAVISSLLMLSVMIFLAELVVEETFMIYLLVLVLDIVTIAFLDTVTVVDIKVLFIYLTMFLLFPLVINVGYNQIFLKSGKISSGIIGKEG